MDAIWWIGLVIALLLTLVLLKHVFLIVRVLRQILYLAECTRDASRALAADLEDAPRLEAAAAPARELRSALAELASAAGPLARRAAAARERA